VWPGGYAACRFVTSYCTSTCLGQLSYALLTTAVILLLSLPPGCYFGGGYGIGALTGGLISHRVGFPAM
jgi:hypothetical protein